MRRQLDTAMASDQNTELEQRSVPLNYGSRKFYDIDFSEPRKQADEVKSDLVTSGLLHDSAPFSDEKPKISKKDDLLRYIQSNVVGKDEVFVGPFGRRCIEYCDYIASGRSLSFIEDYIYQNVLSHYGNTHTTTSVCSLQTTLLRHEARDVIRNSVNASEHDCILFEGSGATGAIHKLIHSLDLLEPPIVIVSPFEHHSNLLPWREMGSKVFRVQETSAGQMDVDHLERVLKSTSRGGVQVIGAFSAASNITGTLVDANIVTALCHKYGALVVWDYASAAPYVQIDMNPVIPGISPELVAKDAVFISTHKFVGGVQTPGILIAKKKLFKKKVPYIPGGGTVFFVRRDGQRYLHEVEVREEGGTPAIVESIRAGLVFQLKEAVGTSVIVEREEQLVRQAFSYWKGCDSLLLLGSEQAPRLATFSFVVRHQQTGLYLHHNYICTLLNDLFGIQARGGCACAGPYALDLLGIDEELAKQYEDLLLDDSHLNKEYSHREILRPGFARLNLPYFVDDATITYILEAVRLVAEHGWKLLPQYNFNPETGEWRHKEHQVLRDRAWLGHINYESGHMQYTMAKGKTWIEKTKEPPSGHEDCLKQAQEIFNRADKSRIHLPDQAAMFDEDSNKLRWFLLPSEALSFLQGHPSVTNDKTLPFTVVAYPLVVKQLDNKEINRHSARNGSNTHDAASPSVEKHCVNCSETEISLETIQEGFGERSKRDGSQAVERREEEPCITVDELRNGDVDIRHNHEVSNESGSTEGVIPEAREIASLTESAPTTQPTATNTADGTKPASSFNKTSKRNVAADVSRSSKKKSDKNGHRWHPPPKVIFKPFVQAVEEFSMIRDGDKVLACLSGGKDSLSLLHCLHQYQFYSQSKGIHFELGAVTIDPQTPSYDPKPLKDYLFELGVPYFFEEQRILNTAQNLPYECASICSFCSRMKRGRIYHTARREGYNVLALGQHLDDLAESFLMSVFYNGNLRTMKACYTVEEGDLRVTRPFVYVREADLRRFAEESALPVITENCPACFEAPKERHRMKQLLAKQEVLHPLLFSSVLSAMKPILSINRTGVNVKSLLRDQQELLRENDVDIDEL